MAADVVALIGSGNWGSAIATKMGLNVLDAANGFKPVVKMCVDPGAERDDSRRIARPPDWFKCLVRLLSGGFSRSMSNMWMAANGNGRHVVPAHRRENRGSTSDTDL